MRLLGSNILLGHGPRKFPATEAVGEGAIAVLFTRDQAALGFDLRGGGEAGLAEVTFLTRDGRILHQLTLGPVGEQAFTFARRDMQVDIAGILIQNTDAQASRSTIWSLGWPAPPPADFRLAIPPPRPPRQHPPNEKEALYAQRILDRSRGCTRP